MIIIFNLSGDLTVGNKTGGKLFILCQRSSDQCYTVTYYINTVLLFEHIVNFKKWMKETYIVEVKSWTSFTKFISNSRV